MIKACSLIHRGVLCIKGEERLAFLQGLVTNDVQLLQTQKGIWTGMLSPQGKYQFDFIVYDDSETAWIDCAHTQLPDLFETLQRYQLRSAIEIKECAHTHAVGAFWHLDNAHEGILLPHLFADPRTTALGLRMIAPKDIVQQSIEIFSNQPTDVQEYRKHRMQLGVCDLSEDAQGVDLFWLEANPEVLSGISFNKGCYIGQEVTARMHLRGTVKKKIIAVRTSGTPDTLPAVLRTDVFDVGMLLAAQHGFGFALVQTDRWHDAHESMRMIMAGDILVNPYVPDWQQAA